MTYVIPTGFAQVTLNYTGPTKSGKAATVLAFSLPGPDAEIALPGTVGAAFNDNLKPHLNAEYFFTGCSAVTATARYESVEGAGRGARSSDMAPPQVSVLMKKIVAGRGRGKSGRAYWPGFLAPTDITDSGTLHPGIQSDLTDALHDFLTQIDDLDYHFAVIQQRPEPSGAAVVGMQVENLVATQRRRLR